MTKLAQILLQRTVFLKKCTVIWRYLRSETETNKSVEDIQILQFTNDIANTELLIELLYNYNIATSVVFVSS